MKKVPLYRFRPAIEDTIPLEVVRIEALPKFARMPMPHRHAFYIIFFVTEGTGTHMLDFVQDEVRPNSLHFIGPGQIHYWDPDSELRGYGVLFETALFLETGEQQLLEQINFFHTINGLSVLYLTDEEANWFTKAFETLEAEFQTKRFGRSLSLLASLQLMLVKAQRLADAADETRNTLSADRQLTYRYIQLVDQNATDQHKVEWYASELAITVAHLSKSVKSALDMTAGVLLRNRIVLEAQRLLVHTDMTAGEIADRLNFEDASYFGRFFKREVGQTPRAFRLQYPTKYQKAPTN